MSNFLDRNKVLLTEIAQSAPLRKGPLIGKSTMTTVYQLGSYYSAHLDQVVHLALKEHPYESRGLMDLAVIQVIAEKCPNVYDELPLVHGFLRGKPDEYIGVITEDFSEGRIHKIEEGKDRGFFVFPEAPHELKGTVARADIDTYDLAASSFFVNGKRRIGDFNSFYSGMDIEELERRFMISRISSELEKYVIRISYDP